MVEFLLFSARDRSREGTFACALLSSCSSCSLSFYYSFQVNFFNTLHARRSSRYPCFIVVRRERGVWPWSLSDRQSSRPGNQAQTTHYSTIHDDNSTASSVASFQQMIRQRFFL